MAAQINIEDFTLGELEDIEEKTGLSYDELANMTGNPPLKVIRTFGWILARRSNAEMTWEDTRGIKLGDLTQLMGGAEDPNAGGGHNGRGATSENSQPSSSSTASARRKRSGV